MSSKRTVLVEILLCFIAFAGASWSQPDWPEWRGPGRDGGGAAFGRVADWPDTLELAWRVPAGTGHAGPVVSGDIVCLHSRDDDTESELVSCHDLLTGEQRWSRAYPAPFNTAIGGGHHEAGPKATPTLRDGRLFTFGISGVLSAWDVRTGDLVWRRDFNDEFKKPWPRWGVSASPLVSEGRVYVHAGRKDGAFFALDASTGEEVWRVERVRSAYGSPVLAKLDGVPQIVALSEEGPMGISLGGELLWQFRHKHNQNIPTPVVAGDYVLLSSKGRAMRALRPYRVGERWTISVAWENKEIPIHMSTVVASGDRVCGFSHRKKGFVFCADAASGDIEWRSPPRFSKHAIVVPVPGAFLYFTSDGRLRVVENGDTYREIASYALSESETWSHPAVLERALVVKSYDELLFWRLPERRAGFRLLQ